MHQADNLQWHSLNKIFNWCYLHDFAFTHSKLDIISLGFSFWSVRCNFYNWLGNNRGSCSTGGVSMHVYLAPPSTQRSKLLGYEPFKVYLPFTLTLSNWCGIIKVTIVLTYISFMNEFYNMKHYSLLNKSLLSSRVTIMRYTTSSKQEPKPPNYGCALWCDPIYCLCEFI